MLIAKEGYFVQHLCVLQEEHQGIRKRKEDGEPLNWEDYKKMKFTRNVIINIIIIVINFPHERSLHIELTHASCRLYAKQ